MKLVKRTEAEASSGREVGEVAGASNTAPSLTVNTLSYVVHTIHQYIDIAGSPIIYLIRYEQSATAYGHPLTSYEITQMRGLISGITDRDYELIEAGFRPPHDAKIWLKPPFTPKIGDRLQDPSGIKWEVRGIFPRVLNNGVLFYEVALRRLMIAGYLSGFPADQIFNGLVGYWPLDEGQGGLTYDYSGYKNHGTLVNAPIWTTGKLGGALQFNGVNQYVQINLPSLQAPQLTITGWYLTTASSGTTFSITTNPASSSAPQINIGISGTKLQANLYTGTNNYVADQTASNDGQWHSFALSFGSNTAQLYRDGNLVASISLSYSYSAWQQILIGQQTGLGYGPFNGIIDDIRMYNKVLAASEVATIYSANIVAPPRATF